LTAQRWLSEGYTRIVEIDLPRAPRPDWLIWHPDAPMVMYALSRCFEKELEISVDTIDPPLKLSIYRRRISGNSCLDGNK
jgi:hypothetical protein